VLDPTATQTIDERALHSRAGYDPFHGFEVRGVPRLTLSRGEVIARDGQLLSRPGRGQLLLRERKPG
jgi:dihydropyrimidinase